MTYSYDSWGSISSTDGTMASSLGKLNPLRYRGYCYDEETGLYYLQSRYYSPDIGRFINADGQFGEDILGSNLFAYCANCPINYSDYFGTAITVAFWGGLSSFKIIGGLILGSPAGWIILGVAAACSISYIVYSAAQKQSSMGRLIL